MSSSRQSTSSSLSGTLSDTSRNSISPPFTAGHLALASGLEDLHLANHNADIPEAAISQVQDEQVRGLMLPLCLGIHVREDIAARFNLPRVAVSRRLRIQ
jgi:hypothetical protein